MCNRLDSGQVVYCQKDLKMTSLTSSPGLWHNLAALFTFPVNADIRNSVPDHSEENRRAEQDMFRDMIWSNTEAFSSELDDYYRMHLCRGGR